MVRGQAGIVALFQAHRRDLVRYAARITGDHGWAEDVVQEAWLRYGAKPHEREPNDPVRYLYRIVRNLAIDGRRAILREKCVVTHCAQGADTVPEDRPSPESVLQARDEIRLLEQALAELPARTRTALHMHRLGNCTLKEISDHLGVSVGTAHALVIDGLEHCRARLYRR